MIGTMEPLKFLQIQFFYIYISNTYFYFRGNKKDYEDWEAQVRKS